MVFTCASGRSGIATSRSTRRIPRNVHGFMANLLYA
jgi:hypothetical protein